MELLLALGLLLVAKQQGLLFQGNPPINIKPVTPVSSVTTIPMDSATAAALNTTPSVTENSPAVQNELNSGCMG